MVLNTIGNIRPGLEKTLKPQSYGQAPFGVQKEQTERWPWWKQSDWQGLPKRRSSIAEKQLTSGTTCCNIIKIACQSSPLGMQQMKLKSTLQLPVNSERSLKVTGIFWLHLQGCAPIFCGQLMKVVEPQDTMPSRKGHSDLIIPNRPQWESILNLRLKIHFWNLFYKLEPSTEYILSFCAPISEPTMHNPQQVKLTTLFMLSWSRDAFKIKSLEA